MISSFASVFPSPNVLNALRKRLQPGQKAYLVGGVVRDALLGLENHDLDFVVSGDVRRLAKQVANDLGAAFYMMDLEHQTARVVCQGEKSRQYNLDFSALRGADIDQDLAARDFSINAMAVDIEDLERIIDPLRGAQDLKDRRLRACSPTSFRDDPVRLLRAVRHAVALQLSMDSNTINWLKEASADLPLSSLERQRDEFFRILEGRKVDTAVRILDQFGLLELILPEVTALKHEAQPPHAVDVWEHTIATLSWLEKLIDLLAAEYHEEKGANLVLGLAALYLGTYRDQLRRHFDQPLVSGRTVRGDLFLAALLHDTGKPGKRTVDSAGRTHFYGHEMLSADIARQRARAMVLSNKEMERIELLVRQHLRIHLMAKAGVDVNQRSIYRYFRDTGQAGIDLCFLSLADTLAMDGVTILPVRWERELTICRQVLQAWFDQYDQVVDPPRLIDGDDLMNHFQLHPGPMIGMILDAIREEQGAGQITTTAQALRLAQELIDRTNEE